MDTLFGLPAHPLLVHIPIVLIPVAAIGVLVMAVKPAWHRRYRWSVLAIGVAGTLGAALAAQAGEQLEHRIVAVEGRQAASGWHQHAEAGDTARNVAFIFLAVLLVFVLVPWWLERRSDADPALSPSRGTRVLTVAVSVLTLIAAVGAVATIIQAGHTGSEAVWEDYVKDSGG